MEKRHNYNFANYHKKAYNTTINKLIVLMVEFTHAVFGEN